MDWELRYRSGDTPWEKGAAAPPLVEWLSLHEIFGRILVPGCGLGHDVRTLARAGAESVGLDLAPAAIARAESFPRAGSESYRLANLFELPPELIGAFDWVFEHTCFCAIDPEQRAEYVTAVAAALKSRGRLLAIFYLDPGHGDLDEGPPFGIMRDALDELFASGFGLLEEYVPAMAYPGREGRELVRVLQRRS